MNYKRKSKINKISYPRNIDIILPGVIGKIEKNYKNNPSNIIETWPIIIGKKLAPMTKVESLQNGTLVVKVKNSTLYSLLTSYEKEKILKKLQTKFSKNVIQKLYFKLEIGRAHV